MSKQVRVRIAPSPTGEPHVGTAYTALFNYCFAKSKNGAFILRIEDTDQTRSTKESEESIFDALKWLGLSWNEGPDIGGNYGPYRQSERLSIYHKHAKELVEKGAAYYCFCTQERLKELHEKQKAAKEQLGYDGKCSKLSLEEAEKKIKEGKKYVIRLRVPKDNAQKTSFYDEIRKKYIEYDNNEIDDQILIKTDGFPTYHLANVVDDHLMKITHVIRAEEWIPSTPKHVILYNAFGWEMPKFIHLSLLRNIDRSKVSKRKNPVSLRWFRAAGYTKDAIINFLALMGYNINSDNEKIGLSEIAEDFDINRLSNSSPVFDMVKLDSINEEYIRSMDKNEYVNYLKSKIELSSNYLNDLMPEIQKRHKIGMGFEYWTDMFFENNLDYNYNDFVTKKFDKGSCISVLKQAAKGLKKSNIGKISDLEKVIYEIRGKSGFKIKDFMMTLRIAVTGRKNSLPLYESMMIIGKDHCVKRINDATELLKSHF